jgi:hypothetical protein
VHKAIRAGLTEANTPLSYNYLANNDTTALPAATSYRALTGSERSLSRVFSKQHLTTISAQPIR